jgi:hypothetical protein
MNRRVLATLVLTLLLLPVAIAAAQPNIKPKTGTYKGKETNTQAPGVLKVTKAGNGFSVSSLKLTFHVSCDAGEKDVPIVVSGKLHKMTITSAKGTPVGSYGFSKQKKTEGGAGGTSTFYNLNLFFLSSKRAEVQAVYTEDTSDAQGNPLTGCESGQLTWKLHK